jgi:hypothetical protein
MLVTTLISGLIIGAIGALVKAELIDFCDYFMLPD